MTSNLVVVTELDVVPSNCSALKPAVRCTAGNHATWGCSSERMCARVRASMRGWS